MSGGTSSRIGVIVAPGATQLAVMGRSPISRARLRVKDRIAPFAAVLDGRQQLQWQEFVRPAQLGIAIAVGVFWWAHRFIPTAGELMRNSALQNLLG